MRVGHESRSVSGGWELVSAWCVRVGQCLVGESRSVPGGWE